jgi:hypothetical protein
MSQEMLPENPGVASSLVMGLGWGIAGIALTLAGNLADALGITITLIILSFVPLLSVFFCMAIIEEEKAQPRQTLGTVQPTLSTKEGSRKI